MPNTTPTSIDPGSLNSQDFGALQLDGQKAVEFLPWLINGSLENNEAQAVRDLLGTDFEADLAATDEMFWLTGQHVSSLALTEFALGLPTSELSHGEIEAHVAICSSCQAEVDLIRADDSEEAASEEVAPVAPVIDFTSARRTRTEEARPAATARPKWRVFALAAALATAVAGALLVQVAQDLETSPAHDVASHSVAADTMGITTVAQVQAAGSGLAEGEKNLRSLTPDTALFLDGFESGDTGGWSTVSN